MDYPYKSIIINNRSVSISGILNGTETALSSFEEHVFGFLTEWITRVDSFAVKTSGSTGPAKTIILKRSQMIASAEATARALGLREGHRALICLDARFIAGKMMIVRSLHTQLEMVFVEPSANPLQILPENFFIDFTALVPYQLMHILHSPQRDRLASIGTVIIGGSAVTHDIIQAIQSLKTRFFATYGMTETITHVALQALNGVSATDAFTTLPGISVATDSRGCLLITGAYFNSPLVTNDLAEVIHPASFRWLGRIDNVINSGGFKMSPESIEQRINGLKSSLNLHDRFVISSVHDTMLGDRTIIVFEREWLSDDLRSQIFAYLRNTLGNYEVPKAIFTLFPFPQTDSGKIDRKAVKAMLSERL
jgi:o-succinylbenzoate---CoA ligase